MNRVLLVHMPFAAVSQPSIALGLLKACLGREKIPCDVEYANIAFAGLIGLDTYDRVSELYNAFLGEWMFAGDLFRDRAVPDERYVDRILRRRYKFGPAFVSEMLEVRRRVPELLDGYLRSIDWASYAIVGFTSNYQQTTASLALGRRVKERHPGVAVVMGGANCEGEMGAALFRLFPFLDAVFSGESEETFVAYARTRLAGEPLGQTAGVVHRHAGAASIPRRLVASVADLDTVPCPDYDDYFRALAASGLGHAVTARRDVWAPASPQTLAQTSRGCWWGEKSHCTFCGLNGRNMRYRAKSPERAVEELSQLHDKYGCFLLVVDNILDPRYAAEALPQLRSRCPGVGLFYETRASLDKAQLTALKSAGVASLQPGIESLSTAILQLVGKGTTLLTNLQLIKWCKELGIALVWPYLWGFPGEDPREYEGMVRVIDKVRHLPPPSSVIKVQLHRFSPYFWDPARHGVRNVRPHPSYGGIYPFPQSDIAEIAYYFTFEYADGRDPARYARPLVDAVTRWRQEHGHHDLSYRPQGRDVVVRSVARTGEARWRLRGVHAEVFQHCDALRTLASIRRHVREVFDRPLPDEDLAAVLADLAERDLVLAEGPAYLTLATRDENLGDGRGAETLG